MKQTKINFKKEDIIRKLEGFLSPERLLHSINVAKTAVELAKIYDEDLQFAEIAGLMHDAAKELDVADYEKLGISIKKIPKFDYFLKHAKGVIHSFASRQVVENYFKIKNAYILQAIESHCLGNSNMTRLDKIIFVADLIEPSRKFKGIKNLRQICFKDLDEGMILSMGFTLKFLIDDERFIVDDAVKNWNSLIKNDDKIICR